VTSSPSPSPPASWKGRGAAAENLPHLRCLERLRPQALQLGRGLREDHDGHAVCGDDEPGRRSGEPEHDRPVGHARLLAHALRELRVRAAQPLRDHARDLLDPPLELVVHPELAPGDARDRLHRAVVVGRAEPAGGDDEVGGRDGVAHGVLELARPVADDHDLRRLEAEREHGAREVRPVQVRALPAHELRARDDDRGPGSGARGAQAASAAKIRFAVTKTPCALTAPGSLMRLPLRRTSTFWGRSSRTQSTWPSKNCFWPCSSVPW
jgi:hypothetical protein